MNKNIRHRQKKKSAEEHAEETWNTKKNGTKRKTLPSNDYGSGLFVKIRCEGSREKELGKRGKRNQVKEWWDDQGSRGQGDPMYSAS